MVIAVPAFIVVSVIRLAAWPKSGLLTIAMLLTSAAYIAGTPEVDRAIDQRRIFGFANVSDLAQVVLMLLAWWTVGIVWMRVLRRRPQPKGPYDPYRATPRGRYARAVRAWTYLAVAAAVVAVLMWRIGHISQHETLDAFELHDLPTVGFTVTYLAMLAVTQLLAISASAIAWRTDRAPRFWLAVMGASAVCGLGYAITCAVLLVTDRERLHRDYVPIAEAWSTPGIGLFALAGIVWICYRKHDTV